MFLSDDEIIESLELYLKSVEEQINYLKSSVRYRKKIRYQTISFPYQKVFIHIKGRKRLDKGIL